MKVLQKIFFVLLLTTFSSVYGGGCSEKPIDVDDCRVRAESGIFKKGDAKAQYNLGIMYFKGLGVRQDSKQAVKWWKKSAEQGFADAQTKLGGVYKFGVGDIKDYKQSFKWFKKSAEQGDAVAQSFLGEMYDKGQGVPKDYVRAHMCWNIAAISGDKDAIKNRGLIEKDMTSSQLAEAQELAQEWMGKH